jgi:competence protein ComEC
LLPSRAAWRSGPDLDLSPPVRLDLWAVLVAAGIAVGTFAPPLAPVLLVAGFIVATGALLWRDLVPAEWRLMAVLAPFFAAGGVTIALLHAATPDPLAELAAMEPGQVVLVGRIASPPETSGFGYMADLRVERLWYEGREVLRGGGVEVFATDLMATKRISALVEATSVRPVGKERGWIGQVHRRTDVALGYGLRPREAAVVRGMVLGDRSLMPEELEKAFQRSGITHVLAISGQHVVILAAVIYFAIRIFAIPPTIRAGLTTGLLWIYILIAGAPPSAIRAGVVATFVLAAPLLGRQVSPLHFMTTMLALVLAYNPQLIYSTGFQLSVAAVFGILLLTRPLKSLVERTLLRPLKSLPGQLSNLISVSLAAQIATSPIVAATFEQVSIVGVFTNLVAVPLSGPILILGLLGSLVGNIYPLIAYPLNACNGFLVTMLIQTAQGSSSLPFASVTTPGVTLFLVGLFYAGCVPPIVAERVFSSEHMALWAALLLVWSVLWLVLVAAGSI